MNFDKLNRWLILIANVGVLAGIFVVVFELQQTQTAMNSEASTVRSQIAAEIGTLAIEYDITLLSEKLESGESLSQTETKRLRLFWTRMLRYYENLHYQWEIGVLDEEIWESNVSGISFLSERAGFRYAFPGWPDDQTSARYRSSFVELVESFRK